MTNYCCTKLEKSQCVDDYNGKWFLESEHDPTEYINFCPFCGEALK